MCSVCVVVLFIVVTHFHYWASDLNSIGLMPLSIWNHSRYANLGTPSYYRESSSVQRISNQQQSTANQIASEGWRDVMMVMNIKSISSNEMPQKHLMYTYDLTMEISQNTFCTLIYLELSHTITPRVHGTTQHNAKQHEHRECKDDRTGWRKDWKMIRTGLLGHFEQKSIENRLLIHSIHSYIDAKQFILILYRKNIE